MAEHALYLEKDGEVKLFHADDVDKAKGDGWKEPDGQRANGYAFNRAEDLQANDAAAGFLKAKADEKSAEDKAPEKDAEPAPASASEEAKS